MCRGKNICSELGTDPNKWDKFTPLPKPAWAENQIDLFELAVTKFIDGNKAECLNIIQQIKSNELSNWFIEHGQMSGRHRNLSLKIIAPNNVDVYLRDNVRSPIKIQNKVFMRDGYKCRYCNCKLISQEFIKLFIKKLNSPLFQKGSTNLTTHGIIHLAWPVADHVIPWNQGGRTNQENLVSSCAPCNYGKDGYTIEQLGLNNPFDRLPSNNNWCGLTEKISELKKINTY